MYIDSTTNPTFTGILKADYFLTCFYSLHLAFDNHWSKRTSYHTDNFL